MKNNVLKKLTPRSLYGRFLLIIILPMVIVQMVATYMFYERHWSSMNRNMSASLSGEIAMVIDKFIKAPKDKKQDVINQALKFMSLNISHSNNGLIDKHNVIPEQYLLFRNGLRYHFNYPFNINKEGENIKIRILLPEPTGGILSITTTKKRLANPTTYIFIMWMVGTAVVLLGVSILFLRNQVRSIVRLTQAAEKFGKGHDMPSFKPQGAREIRLAAIAFIQMRERIKRLLNRRTQMLAGVSHDLRTPLTRMKLQLEMMNKCTDIDDMQSDIREMESMLDGYLEFAKEESDNRKITHKELSTVNIKLYSFFEDILKGFRNHEGSTKNNINKEIAIHGHSDSLKRCITNIIDNALKYSNKVEISCQLKESIVIINIDDNGIGIQKDDWKKVFQPFYRVDKSRSQKTGGTGLGLTIASDIIHKHGGEIKLGKSKMGGLHVEILLPI